MKALIVSRTLGARAWLRSALGPVWTVDEAADGVEAVTLVKASPPDLVIADESTEPYGAFGLARELKFGEAAPAVMIILDRGQDVWLARWSGADRWLIQPVDPFAVARAAQELATARSGAPSPAD